MFWVGFDCLWLFVSIKSLAADPGRWGYWFMLLLGVLAVVGGFHPISRTPLTWPAPQLQIGELAVIQQRCSWVSGIARGGTLTVTDRRILFEPNSVKAALGLRTTAWDRTSVTCVEVAPRTLNLLGGGLGRRVRLTWSDGHTELFVAEDPEQFATRLEAELLPATPGLDPAS